jgi:hypothetical protein
VLNQARLLNPDISGGTAQGMTLENPLINAGVANSLFINESTIDCLTLGCTQPLGTQNNTLATTAFVYNAIVDVLTQGDPEVCAAVIACIESQPSATCNAVANCIHTVPGIINTVQAFGPGAQATQLAAGVTRYATSAEVLSGACGVASEPCTMIGVLGSALIPSPFWTAVQNAVNQVLAITDLCALTAGCGYQTASDVSNAINSAIGALDFCALTAGCGYQSASDVSSAITTALGSAISSGNPAFCAAVAGCGGGGGGGAIFLQGTVAISNATPDPCPFSGGTVTAGSAVISCSGTFPQANCSANPYAVVRFTFNTPQPNANYGVLWPDAIFNTNSGAWIRPIVLTKTTTYIEFTANCISDGIGGYLDVTSGTFMLVESA